MALAPISMTKRTKLRKEHAVVSF